MSATHSPFESSDTVPLEEETLGFSYTACPHSSLGLDIMCHAMSRNPSSYHGHVPAGESDANTLSPSYFYSLLQQGGANLDVGTYLNVHERFIPGQDFSHPYNGMNGTSPSFAPPPTVPDCFRSPSTASTVDPWDYFINFCNFQSIPSPPGVTGQPPGVEYVEGMPAPGIPSQTQYWERIATSRVVETSQNCGGDLLKCEKCGATVTFRQDLKRHERSVPGQELNQLYNGGDGSTPSFALPIASSPDTSRPPSTIGTSNPWNHFIGFSDSQSIPSPLDVTGQSPGVEYVEGTTAPGIPSQAQYWERIASPRVVETSQTCGGDLLKCDMCGTTLLSSQNLELHEGSVLGQELNHSYNDRVYGTPSPSFAPRIVSGPHSSRSPSTTGTSSPWNRFLSLIGSHSTPSPSDTTVQSPGVEYPEETTAPGTPPPSGYRERIATQRVVEISQGRRKIGGNLYKCEKCGATLTSRQNLKYHTNAHFNKKPFLCGECQRRFGTPHDRNRHHRKCTVKNNQAGGDIQFVEDGPSPSPSALTSNSENDL